MFNYNHNNHPAEKVQKPVRTTVCCYTGVGRWYTLDKTRLQLRIQKNMFVSLLLHSSFLPNVPIIIENIVVCFVPHQYTL